MTPTQEQIKQAQEAGNEAMDSALWYDMATPEQAYDAYRAAYALALAAAEVGVTAEHLTPREVAMQNSDEMKRIAADAMQNQPPIEY